MELDNLTILQAHQGLIKKEFSALELCKAYLDRIKEKNGEIFSFLTLTEDLALSQAKKIDDFILGGRKIPILAGIPLAVKDNILVENIKCTAASKILENYIAPYDATVIKKLKNQGAVIFGKTNMDEFAMGSSTEHSSFGKTRNPLDFTRVPGGSSGGSAAAVAGNLCCYALGSDTGGSIRQPASFCGVVGLKPTYGAVSRYGLIAFASSLDQIGPITKTVEDTEIVFDVIKGQDEMDSTSVEIKSKAEPSDSWARREKRTKFSATIKNRVSIYGNEGEEENEVLFAHQISKTELPQEARGKKRTKSSSPIKINELRIGIPKEYFIKGMDPEVEKLVKEAIKKFENLGAKIEEISLPHTEYALPTYYIIAPSEASANLARYDGIKYGLHPPTALPPSAGPLSKIKNLLDYYLKIREEGFGDEVRRRIMLGTSALSAGYYEAYYLRAQKVRTLIKEDFDKAFQKVDAILTPTSPTPAFKLGEKSKDPLTMYLSDIFTVSVNLAGLPALSIPCGKVGRLPVGLQIIGKAFEENKILEIGRLFEKN